LYKFGITLRQVFGFSAYGRLTDPTLFADESLDDEEDGAGVLEDTAEDQQEAERQALILLKKLQDLKVFTRSPT
jgi:hypothetical protein